MKPYAAAVLIGILLGTVFAVKDTPPVVDRYTLGFIDGLRWAGD